MGDEEPAQYLLVTQELGNKVTCEISESQQRENPRQIEEKTDELTSKKGKVITFDTEKHFIADKLMIPGVAGKRLVSSTCCIFYYKKTSDVQVYLSD